MKLILQLAKKHTQQLLRADSLQQFVRNTCIQLLLQQQWELRKPQRFQFLVRILYPPAIISGVVNDPPPIPMIDDKNPIQDPCTGIINFDSEINPLSFFARVCVKPEDHFYTNNYKKNCDNPL